MSLLAQVNAVPASHAMNVNNKYPTILYKPAELQTVTITNMQGFQDISASNRLQLIEIIEKDYYNIEKVQFCILSNIVKITIKWNNNETKFLCYPKNSRVIRRFIVKGEKTALFKQIRD